MTCRPEHLKINGIKEKRGFNFLICSFLVTLHNIYSIQNLI